MKTVRSKDGTRIAYDVYGQGPVMIFITGAICFRKFGPVVTDAKVFGQKFTVYCYDRRGRGDSGDTKPYALEREVEDIEALIDAAGGSAVLYGHSSGAVLALEAGLRLPQKVKRVAIYDAAYAHNKREQDEYRVLMKAVSTSLREHKNAQALKQFTVGIGMPKIFALMLPFMPGWKSMRTLAPTLEYDMLLTVDLPPVARLAEFKQPLLVAYGEKSPISMHEVAKQIAAANAAANVVRVDGQDHMISPKKLLPLLARFLKSPEL